VFHMLILVPLGSPQVKDDAPQEITNYESSSPTNFDGLLENDRLIQRVINSDAPLESSDFIQQIRLSKQRYVEQYLQQHSKRDGLQKSWMRKMFNIKSISDYKEKYKPENSDKKDL